MKQVLFTIVLFTTTLSCSEVVVNPQYTVLSLSGTKEIKVDCKDYFEPIEIIPLKETSDFYIKAIKKIESFNDELFVLCNNSKNVLAVFNHSGEKIREIGQYGNGHGEYGQIYDFCVDKKNQRVLILCANSHVIVYDLSGKYLSEKRISDSPFGNIACINGNVLCTTNHQTFTEGDNTYLFYLFDEKFDIITKHTNVLPDYMGMFSLQTAPLKVINDFFIYSDFYTHRIYVLDSLGEMVQTYHYGDRELMPSKLFRDYHLFTENQFKYGFILDNIFLDDKIISIYKTNSQVRISINNKKGTKMQDFPIKGVIPKLYSIDGKYILSVATIEELEESGIVDYENKTESFFFVIKYDINHLK